MRPADWKGQDVNHILVRMASVACQVLPRGRQGAALSIAKTGAEKCCMTRLDDKETAAAACASSMELNLVVYPALRKLDPCVLEHSHERTTERKPSC